MAFTAMEPGEKKLHVRLQGFLKLIRSDQLKSKVNNWQKFFVNASSKFNLDTFHSPSKSTNIATTSCSSGGVLKVEDSSVGSSNLAASDVWEEADIEERLADQDVCSPSDSGETIVFVPGTGITSVRQPLMENLSGYLGSDPVDTSQRQAHLENLLIVSDEQKLRDINVEFEEVEEEKSDIPDSRLLSSDPPDRGRDKSPVQQWVDSLPLEDPVKVIPVPGREEDAALPVQETEGHDSEVEAFTLGAEAVGVTSPRPYPYVHVTNACNESDTGSHCSSMESLLESRKPDPEEVLLELGFGGSEEPDTVSRIPARFLQPSSLKGVAIDDFLRHQQMMVHTYQSGFSGYRGLTGPCHSMPSGIVGKIMERLREAEVHRNNMAQHQHPYLHCHSQHNHNLNLRPGPPTTATTTHPSNVSRTGLGVGGGGSVLSSPDNRRWMERQGVSPEPEGRRLILGKAAYRLGKDGGLVREETAARLRTPHESSVLLKNGTENSQGEENLDLKNRNQEIGRERASNEMLDNEEQEINERNEDFLTERKLSHEVVDEREADRRASLPVERNGRFVSFNGNIEMEYKTIALLANQLKGSDVPVKMVTEEEFYQLGPHQRKMLERDLVERALTTYQSRLGELDLRCHLRQVLSSQADRLTSALGGPKPPGQAIIQVVRQMTTLLRHQETLRQELRLTRDPELEGS